MGTNQEQMYTSLQVVEDAISQHFRYSSEQMYDSNIYSFGKQPLLGSMAQYSTVLQRRAFEEKVLEQLTGDQRAQFQSAQNNLKQIMATADPTLSQRGHEYSTVTEPQVFITYTQSIPPESPVVHKDEVKPTLVDITDHRDIDRAMSAMRTK